MHFILAFILSFSLFSQAKVVQPEDLKIDMPVEYFQLENGLKVILAPDNSVPIISYHVWFDVGSKHEEPGYTGIAHLFEHMMFKGTKNIGNKEFDILLKKNGIVNNAFTSRDYTGYYENLPTSKLELVMKLESDRMRNLIIDDSNLKSEREVVKSERLMRVDNNVRGQLFQLTFATVFKVSPYRWPVIGYNKDLDRVDVKKSEEFYQAYYAPNNAVLVIAGDIQLEKTKSLVKKYYSQMEAQKIPPLTISSEPKQSARRRTKIFRDIQSPLIAISFKAPKISDKDAYPLDLLAAILSEGKSSRLYHKLVYEKQIANSVNAYYYGMKEEGIFTIMVDLKPGKSVSQARRLIESELWRLQKSRFNERELEKAKNLIFKNYVKEFSSVDSRARMLAVNQLVLGDYKESLNGLNKYAQVNAKDISLVANKYLLPKQQSVVEIFPKNKKVQ